MVRRNSIGKYRWNSDDFAVNRNVVGISSEYTDELPTTTTVTFFIGMSSKSRRNFPTNHISSEFRRKWPTEFRRLIFFGFGRKFVSIPSQMSDDLGVRRNLRRNSMCFLVVIDWRIMELMILVFGKWKVEKTKWLFKVDNDRGSVIVGANEDIRFEDFVKIIFADYEVDFAENDLVITLWFI
ncbi:hypothetical protein DY000_02014113 [Brassica cretica]|uniref:DUF4283 domain-containing protein n=1 Tax=Brassica cretica TaxID=69181 RepID=A0ABQ7CXT1_BRACR|nr:hypothetical protein DY000_02014113 [Brassica cretica]